MPIPSPFHPRTSALCTSLRWKDWAGYHAVCSFDTYHEREYYAFRHGAGMIDVTPLFKYDVTGPDAQAFLSYVMVRNIAKLKPSQVSYTCWCDDDGKLLDDGTVWRLDDTAYRVTAAEPSFAWLTRNACGFDVDITDITEQLAALSIQGPTSRTVLRAAGVSDIESLRFFKLMHTTIGNVDAVVTRTGYTGDLGYEVWVRNDDATALWDTLHEAGRPHGLQPAGLDALDMTRIEAGFIMNGVDYYSANHCIIESRQSTPDEGGLGWTVHLDRDPFIGQAAIRAERDCGSVRAFVGLVYDWDEYESLHDRYGLPPEVCTSASRDALPVYAPSGKHIGQITSRSWSPLLKQYLALATVDAAYQTPGTVVHVEVTVEYVRHMCKALVTDRPFFDPPRKRS